MESTLIDFLLDLLLPSHPSRNKTTRSKHPFASHKSRGIKEWKVGCSDYTSSVNSFQPPTPAASMSVWYLPFITFPKGLSQQVVLPLSLTTTINISVLALTSGSHPQHFPVLRSRLWKTYHGNDK